LKRILDFFTLVFYIIYSLLFQHTNITTINTTDFNTTAVNTTTVNTTTEQTSNTIKIGVIEPLTGVSAAGGEEELRGIKIANKLHPTALGKKIELVIVDNKSDKTECVNAASKLVSDKVSAVLGSWSSSLSIAAGPVFENAQIPAVCANCTNPLFHLSFQ